jgi:cobalt-zinc-cadmium efflux system membrane fusion protein
MYIEKQQEYLEIKSEMTFLSQEMERQKRLSEANAAALKFYQKAQSEYAIKDVKLKGIEQYLKYLGINTNNLNSGNITQTISLISPISGIVETNNLRNGMLANPETELMTIIGNSHIHLELEVFESDIHQIKVGQNLSFSMASNPKETYKGKVYLIAPTFEAATKTVHVHAHILGKQPRFLKGAFVNAKIFENESAVPVLPEKAVINHEGKDYIFVEGKKTLFKTVFHQIPVKVNQKNNGFWAVEPLAKMKENAIIVTKGAFYVNSEMNKADHGHSH